jgi:radical SAM superfamily enzyme YgiQ (UPF0313 family)
LDELEEIPQKFIYFIDDNLVGFSKKDQERAIELFQGMIERKIKKYWFSLTSMNVANNEEVLEYAFKSGCRMLFIGVESENPDALKEINKKANLKIGPENYEEAFSIIHRHRISILGSFIYGFDTDTSETLDKRTKYIINSGVDAVEISIY